jgi:ribosomal protein S18 acetylase RimI-like enzyme
MPEQRERPFIIEPFDPARHDRESFSCGIPAVDNYFRKTANKLAKADNIRLYVMVAPDGAVIGFYSINAHAVGYEDLPSSYARTRPAHGSIPAAFIAMIGRDQRYRNQGFGSDLLVDALTRIARASDAIGISVVMLDVFDCGDPERVRRRKALYEGFGFMPLPSRPLRLFLPIATVRRLLAEGD